MIWFRPNTEPHHVDFVGEGVLAMKISWRNVPVRMDAQQMLGTCGAPVGSCSTTTGKASPIESWKFKIDVNELDFQQQLI